MRSREGSRGRRRSASHPRSLLPTALPPPLLQFDPARSLPGGEKGAQRLAAAVDLTTNLVVVSARESGGVPCAAPPFLPTSNAVG